MTTTDAPGPVTIRISVDEWRDIATWMHQSLDSTEQSPHGHFLLECEGTTRRWVTSDGVQATIVHGDGPAPRGVTDPGAQFSVLVNSRLFRGRTPQDGELTVFHDEGGRLMTLSTDGVEITLPEHPATFPNWREVLDGPAVEVRVDTSELREACGAASVIPFGVEPFDPVVTAVSVSDGRLRLHTPWVDHPSTIIRIPLLGETPVDTPEVLIDAGRLRRLVDHVEVDTTALAVPTTPTGRLRVRADRYVAVLAAIDRWGRERARLEQLLCEFLHVEAIHTDEDGDYPIPVPHGPGIWARLITNVEPVTVQVFSVIVADVGPAAELFAELNAINANAPYVKLLWATGAVMAEVDLVAATVDADQLANALHVVRRAADRYHGLLSAFFASHSADSTDSED